MSGRLGVHTFIHVVLGPMQLPLYECVLFSAPQQPALDPLREEVFLRALDDSSIEAAVLAAESESDGQWLNIFVSRLTVSVHPADQALALTVAGLRHDNEHSGGLFGESWGPGFLGTVYAAAAENYRRAQWAKHWLQRALNASDPIDFWRFGKLAEGVADWRFARQFAPGFIPDAPLVGRFGAELYERLEKAAKERMDKRKESLFGLKAPDRELVRALKA